MASTDFKSVDEYLATFPENVQAILQRVRRTIRKAVPAADEVISYQIPAYKLRGARVIYFAGWKEHYSLYPVSDRIVKSFKAALPPYEIRKDTLRFPLSKPVPVKLIEHIAKVRAKEASEYAKATPSRARKPAQRTTAKS
jgi:uncharacterized protein YdhG (YjbR/CyaY superfamily)